MTTTPRRATRAISRRRADGLVDGPGDGGRARRGRRRTSDRGRGAPGRRRRGARGRRRRQPRARRSQPRRGPRAGCRGRRSTTDAIAARLAPGDRPGCRRRRSRRRAGSARGDGRPAPRWPVAVRLDAAEPAIDPAQVAQVAGQRGRIVERAVEQLDGVGAALHAAGYAAPAGMSARCWRAWRRAAVRFGRLSGVPSGHPSPGASRLRPRHAGGGRSGGEPIGDGRGDQPRLPDRDASATAARTSARSRACSDPSWLRRPDRRGLRRLRRGRRSGPSRPRAACRSTASSATTTWVKLVVRARRRAAQARRSRSLQRQLNEKRFAGLTVDGVYGTATRTAVITFQKHMGMTATRPGRAGHLADPAVAFRLPGVQRDEPVRLRRRQRDGQLGDRGRDRPSRGRGRDVRGDGSRPGLGRRHQPRARWRTSPLHETHEVGSRRRHPARSATRGNQCTWGTNWRFASYDRDRDPGAHQDDPGRRRPATSS